MSRARKPVDLTFGAEISAIGVVQSPTVKDLDGREYDFRFSTPSNPSLGAFLATAFSLLQSKNEREHSRASTNATLALSIKAFGRWAENRPDATFSPKLLTAYRNDLFATRAASTAYNLYTCLARAVKTLMATNFLPRFNIPENASRNAVSASTSSSGASLATALSANFDSLGADEANEALLKTWINAAWTEADALFERLDNGDRWRSEACSPTWSLPQWFVDYQELFDLNRADVLRLCKTICVLHLDGKTPERWIRPKPDANPSWSTALHLIASRVAPGVYKRISISELKQVLADPSVPLMTLPSWAANPVLKMRGQPQEWLKLVIQLMERRFGGYPLGQSAAAMFLGLPDDPEVQSLRRLLRHAIAQKSRFSALEIISYFYPTPALAGLTYSLLCCSQINPESAAHLSLGDMIDDERKDRKRLQWSKGRAGGAQSAIPFPVGGPSSRTIPRLWASFEKASTDLRAQMPLERRRDFFIWASGQSGDKPWGSFRAGMPVSPVWNHLRKYLSGALEGMTPAAATLRSIAPLAPHLHSVTPALLRNTAINIASARLNRDFKATATMDGRKSISPLENSYLANAQTKDRLDKQIRSGQQALSDWLSMPPLVLPADESIISGSLGVDAALAKDIAADEINAGMGASLVNQRAIFIDTPLNALRAMQWRDKLLAAQSRMLRDNPSRWTVHFEPQIALFSDALHSFSRGHLAEARKMNDEIALPFPEIY